MFGIGNVEGIQMKSLTYAGHKIMLLFKYTMPNFITKNEIYKIHPYEKEEKQNHKHQIQPTNSAKLITELQVQNQKRNMERELTSNISPWRHVWMQESSRRMH